MWVRGLKHVNYVQTPLAHYVASYVGAWIETEISSIHNNPFWVASYVGAWIETHISPIRFLPHHVASYVGAWIETPSSNLMRLARRSHPMWVRGLKLVEVVVHHLVVGRILCGCVD